MIMFCGTGYVKVIFVDARMAIDSPSQWIIRTVFRWCGGQVEIIWRLFEGSPCLITTPPHGDFGAAPSIPTDTNLWPGTWARRQPPHLFVGRRVDL